MSPDRSEPRSFCEIRSATRIARGSTALMFALACGVFVAAFSNAEIQLTRTASARRLTSASAQTVDPEPLLDRDEWRLMTLDKSVWTIDVQSDTIERQSSRPVNAPTVKPIPKPERPRPQPKPKQAKPVVKKTFEPAKPLPEVKPVATASVAAGGRDVGCRDRRIRKR